MLVYLSSKYSLSIRANRSWNSGSTIQPDPLLEFVAHLHCTEDLLFLETLEAYPRLLLDIALSCPLFLIVIHGEP